MLLLLGFAVLFINYSGSIGLGKSYVESLLGKIGDLDVEDVFKAVKSNPLCSNRKLLLYGGSHGGFLVTHLSGQYPVSIECLTSNVCILNNENLHTFFSIILLIVIFFIKIKFLMFVLFILVTDLFIVINNILI